MEQSEAMMMPRRDEPPEPTEPQPGLQERRAAFAALYERELDQQFRRARLIVGSKAAADDVVHDAFVEVWRRWDTIGDPGPYLNRAVANRAINAAQTGKRRLGILRKFYPTTAGDPASAGAGSGGHEVLTDVLRALPVKQRTAIVLRYYAGMSDVEIAAAMDCPTGSVGPWIHRGLGQLRKALS